MWEYQETDTSCSAEAVQVLPGSYQDTAGTLVLFWKVMKAWDLSSNIF